jgi:hypothetical protein
MISYESELLILKVSTQSHNMKLKLFYGLYFCLLVLYAIFSFSLTDPNLVLLNWSPYWNFQQWMWQTFFHNPQLLTWTYVSLITALFVGYFGLTHEVVKTKKYSSKMLGIGYLFLILPLLFSYNMLSHDVFNYIFNAKMVLIYHANPHVKVALDYSYDDWTRFMHNTHTPAPYGYGWTIFSVLPYMLGIGKFLLTWLVFRTLSIISIGILLAGLLYISKFLPASTTEDKKQSMFWSGLVFLFLNPLFLIELVSNSHNDLWMMAPALCAFGLVLSLRKAKLKWGVVALSAVLLGFSISVKLATGLLLPIWLFFILFHFHVWARLHNMLIKINKPAAEALSFGVNFLHMHWPVVCAGLLFLPLLTDRSQQFHPWYLTWILVWLPLISQKWLRNSVLVFSYFSLLRYIPWLLNGGFSDQVIFQQKLITWVVPVLFTAGVFILEIVQFSHQNSSSKKKARTKVQ